MWHLRGIFVAGTYFTLVLLIFDGCVPFDGCRVNKETTVEVQWNRYVQCGRNICSVAYVSNVECMYASVPGHIVDACMI